MSNPDPTATAIRLQLQQDPAFTTTVTENAHGGYDFRVRGSNMRLRVVPLDGEWDAGVDVFLMTGNEVVHQSATLRGCPAYVIGATAAAMAEQV